MKELGRVGQLVRGMIGLGATEPVWHGIALFLLYIPHPHLHLLPFSTLNPTEALSVLEASLGDQ